MCLIIWALLAVCTVVVLFQENIPQFFGMLSLFAFLALGLYFLYWRPRVEFTPDFIRVVNLVRSYRISYGAITDVTTRFTLTIQTVEQDKISVWSAPAPSRYSVLGASKTDTTHLPRSTYQGGTIAAGDMASSESGSAAAILRRAWEGWQNTPEPRTAASISREVNLLLPIVLGALLALTVWLNS